MIAGYAKTLPPIYTKYQGSYIATGMPGKTAQVLEGNNAVPRYREVMRATNPEQAAEGTIRKLYAVNVGENSVHGSDSQENAALEIAQFFTTADIVG